MTTLGLPTAMFWVFVATILAGSLGAIHYVIFHVILGRPFAEIPPPVLRTGSRGPGTTDDGGDPAAEDATDGDARG